MFIGRRHLKLRKRDNAGHAVCIQQRFAVRAVINEKAFVMIPVAEVFAKHGKNAVFRLDLRTQHAAQLRKTDKAAQSLRLA